MPADIKALTVSLIIPAYNEEDHLRACLDLVAAQTRLPDEVIVVDNNSTDATAAIAREYSFVRVIKESQQGIVYARDAGFNAAKSTIIARIDTDSRLPADWVARVRTFYADPLNADAALTGGGYFYNIPARRFNGWLLSQLAYRMNRIALGHYIVWGSNMAITRTMWRKTRDQVCHRNDIHEDMDVAIHLAQAGFSIKYEPGLRVGVLLRRVFSNREQLRTHMARWPQTLKVHDYKLWWFGVLGNLILWYLAQPMLYITEFFKRYVLRRRKAHTT